MLEGLLLHPRTKQNLELFSQKPAHAILLTGPAGSGKAQLAKCLAAEILELDSAQSLESFPYFLHLRVPEGKQDIPIEEVRRVIKLMQLKVPGDKTVRRVFFIEDANLLSQPAQNAILKILEEPSFETVFILTAVSPRSVLPTIASRTQQITVTPVSFSAAVDFFDKQYKEQEIERAWQLSQGRSGLLAALLNNGLEHPLKSAVDESKKFLRAGRYERLLMLDSISQNKEQLRLFLEALDRTLSALHHNAERKSRHSQADRLLNSRKLVKELSKALTENTNTRLIALKLALNLQI
jgi:hypothetical protein